MIGEVLGGYRLIQKLGEGSMGEVYLGEHAQTRQKSAVKVLFPTFSKEGTALTRYFAEIRATNPLGHPGIAAVYDCGMHGSGRAFLCMEYLAGKSLAAALADQENLAEIATLANIGAQVAGALQVQHSKRMVHRALKPDSVFMVSPAPHPVIKLLDFGVANFTQSVRHSQTGSLLGAPLYMSPEVGRGLGNVDHRADIYSLGCILFELATGRPPFVREGAGELIVAHATEAPPSARALEPSIPPELDELLGRTLRKDPTMRPQTMTEIAAILGRLGKPAVPVVQPAAMAATSPRSITQQPTMVAPPNPASIPPQAVTRKSVPPGPAPVPTVAVNPATTSTSSPRKHEPTALLQPSAKKAPPVAATVFDSQPTRKSQFPRHEPTAFLDPPPKPAVASEAPPRPVTQSRQKTVDSPAPVARSINLPVIAIAGGIVLCLVLAAILLLSRRTPVPASNQTKPATAHASARQEFQPPPLPALAQPALPEEKPAPNDVHAQPPRPAEDSQSRPQRAKQASGKPATSGAKEAPRW